jgi:acyl-CoA reductase-like NAD-dependent aldehyde dehydrogenase
MSSSRSIQTFHFINGEYINPSPSAETFDLFNPATEEKVATIPCATSEEINLAVDAAKRAQPAWAAMTPQERGVVMRKLADLIESKAEELSWLETQVRNLNGSSSC